jgi:hypothetical protein
VEAIAAGKRAALMMDRYVRGEALRQPGRVRLPETYVEPVAVDERETDADARARAPMLPALERRRSFDEVERTLSEAEARREARRCLRCDLEFTAASHEHDVVPVTLGASG